MVFRVFGGSLMVLRENKTTPSDADWDAFLAELTAQRPNFKNLRIVVFTDGGGPSSAQRKRLAVALGGEAVRVAVVTESATVRFIVSSIALLNKSIATYHPKDVDKAFAWLALSPSEQKQVEHAREQLGPLIG